MKNFAVRNDQGKLANLSDSTYLGVPFVLNLWAKCKKSIKLLFHFLVFLFLCLLCSIIPYSALYRKIVSFVLLRSGLGSPTDIAVVREATGWSLGLLSKSLCLCSCNTSPFLAFLLLSFPQFCSCTSECLSSDRARNIHGSYQT